MERFTERIHQLYEQGVDGIRIGRYVRNWSRWSLMVKVQKEYPPHRSTEGMGDPAYLQVLLNGFTLPPTMTDSQRS